MILILSALPIELSGDTMDIFPAYTDQAVRVQFLGDLIERVSFLDPLTGDMVPTPNTLTIYPAKHYITPEQRIKPAIAQIEEDFQLRLKQLKDQNNSLKPKE
jgi:excinuclease ABC subunit B